MAPLLAAAVQLQAHDRSAFSLVWPGICERIRQASRAGAQLIVLPEGTIPGYVLGEDPLDADSVASAIVTLRNLARELRAIVVCGLARATSKHAKPFNSAIVIECDGTIAGFADKAFLWHFDRRWFAPAETIAPIQTSLGRLGVLVCADGRMPAIASSLVAHGAQVLIMPTAWVTTERDPANLENIQADLLARIRARENAVPFIAANKCGIELGCVAYCGKSQIVASDGTILALASQREPETITAELHLPAQGIRINTEQPAVHLAPESSTRPRESGYARVAISARDGEHLRAAIHIAEAGYGLAPDAPDRFRCLAESIPCALVDDTAVADPLGLLAYRQSGCQLAVWDAQVYDPAWIVSLARARAAELKIYLIVFDRQGSRAFAVDPDGVVLTSTTAEYAVANFVFDAARTEQTLVAPGTDIAEGIERIDSILRKEQHDVRGA